jgi:7-cyano-7-deazaguanine synthase
MRSILLLSGGLDSTTLLYDLLSKRDEVVALSILYGQKHQKEISVAKEIVNLAGVKHIIKDISGVFGESALTSDFIPVPDGHYTAESMKQTVVPNRNMIFLSIALSLAISLKFDRVAYAAHAGDHTIYPDCRPEFIESLAKVFPIADWHKVTLYAPYMNLTKSEICARGLALGAPLSKTWSCYKGGKIHCGTCGTCIERKEAFAGLVDPTEYIHHGNL